MLTWYQLWMASQKAFSFPLAITQSSSSKRQSGLSAYKRCIMDREGLHEAPCRRSTSSYKSLGVSHPSFLLPPGRIICLPSLFQKSSFQSHLLSCACAYLWMSLQRSHLLLQTAPAEVLLVSHIYQSVTVLLLEKSFPQLGVHFT